MKTKNKHLTKNSIFDIVLTIIFCFVIFIFIYPVWNIIVASFSSPYYAMSLGFKIWPDEWNLSAYVKVFGNKYIGVAYINTIKRVVLAVAIAVPSNVFAGYALSKKLPFRKGLLIFLLITMFFSGGLIPSYVLIVKLGLYNSVWALVLPGAATAWNIFIARNFIKTIPDEIEEAAHIDGAKPLRIMFRIIIPLSMPLIAILTLWTAVANWNEWFGAMIYTKGNDKLVLQLLLRRIIIDVDPAVMGEGALTGLTSQTSPETVKAASVIVTTAPIICFYPFLQKYFVKGIFIGSVKG